MSAQDDISARLAITSEPSTCPACGLPAEILTWGARRWFACDPCADAATSRRRDEESRRIAVAQWEEVTPEEFRKPVKSSLLHPVMAAALADPAETGACLIGETGSGKTRVAYRLLLMAAERGLSVFAVTHALFRRSAVSIHDRDAKRSDEAKAMLRACRHSRALLIDDIGKGAISEAGDEAFFDLLDHRLAHGLLTHWTANSGSAWLKARFGRDRGPAIIRRLRDLTTGRVFNSEARDEARPAA